MIKGYNLDPVLREIITGIPRRKFHVCKADANNADYLYDSIDSGRLFHTIAEALAVAQDYDDVIVWPGTWNEITTLAITQNYLRLLAAHPFNSGHKVDIRGYNNHANTLLTIQAHGVEVAGFRFTPYNTTGILSIQVAPTSWIGGCWIHHNWFYAVATQYTDGIKLGVSGGADACDTVVEDNLFHKGQVHISLNNASRALIQYNHHYQIGAGANGHVGIRFNHGGAIGGFGDVRIRRNEFWDHESGGAYGIQTDYNEHGGDDITITDMSLSHNLFHAYGADTSCITDPDVLLLGRGNYRDLAEITAA